MSESPIGFFEVVRISETAVSKKIRGKLGYMAGWSFEEPGDPVEAYGIWIYDLQEVWSVGLEEVEALGYKDELAEAEHANRPSIRVSRDGEVL